MALRNHPGLFGWMAAGIWLAAGSAVLVRGSQEPAPAAAARPLARFHHVHINSVDPAASIAFYTRRFKSGKATFAGMDAVKTPNGWLLFSKVASAPPNGDDTGFWHIGWGSSNTKAAYDRLIGMGTPMQIPLTEIRRSPKPHQQYFAYATGPGEEAIEIFAESGGDEFEHVHLRAVDQMAAERWYMTHLGTGVVPPPVPQVGPVPPPVWLDRIAFRFQRVQGRTRYESSRGRVLDHFAFSVDDLGRTLARLQSEGVTIIQQPTTILGGELKSAFVEAPDGVQVELVETKR